jgi:polysaccharide export outer membrane protein
MEVTSLIEGKLKEYIKNPVVNIQIQNYKVTVLGDVRNPGTFKIPNERMTILEAIGLAGDLRMTGNRRNVLVIRDVNGVKTEYRLDLTSKAVFSSPAYYLTQNDVVYVEPNTTAQSESTLWRTTGPMFISLTSLVVTTVTLIFR